MSPAVDLETPAAADSSLLDAYSAAVVSVAERLLASVASLRAMRRVRGGRLPQSSGSAVVVTPDGFVGINTALVGPGLGQGLGLAVPVNDMTRRIVASLMTDGRVRRAYLGISGGTRPLPPRAAGAVKRERGVEIVSVVSGSPAAAAGLRPEDIIVELDGAAVEDVGDLQRLMTGDRIGRRLPVLVVRAGSLTSADVVVEELSG